jgi:hypothetical protein
MVKSLRSADWSTDEPAQLSSFFLPIVSTFCRTVIHTYFATPILSERTTVCISFSVTDGKAKLKAFLDAFSTPFHDTELSTDLCAIELSDLKTFTNSNITTNCKSISCSLMWSKSPPVVIAIIATDSSADLAPFSDSFDKPYEPPLEQ